MMGEPTDVYSRLRRQLTKIEHQASKLAIRSKTPESWSASNSSPSTNSSKSALIVKSRPFPVACQRSICSLRRRARRAAAQLIPSSASESSRARSLGRTRGRVRADTGHSVKQDRNEARSPTHGGTRAPSSGGARRVRRTVRRGRRRARRARARSGPVTRDGVIRSIPRRVTWTDLSGVLTRARA